MRQRNCWYWFKSQNPSPTSIGLQVIVDTCLLFTLQLQKTSTFGQHSLMNRYRFFFQTWEMNRKYLNIKFPAISGLYLSKPAILKSGWLRRESLFMMMSNHQFSVTNEIFIWSSNALAYFASCWFQQKC